MPVTTLPTASLPKETTLLPRAWPFHVVPARLLGMTALLAILAFLTLYPLAMLLYGSLHTTPPGMAGSFSLDGYRQVATAQNMVIVLNTIGLALAKTIPSMIVAVALAWILARTDTPCRGALEVLVTLPFFVPPILTAMA